MIWEYFPKTIRKSYLRKFAVVVLLIAVVTGGVGLFLQQQVSAQLTDQTERQLAGMAEDQATVVERWVTENKRTTRMIGRADGLASDDRQRVRETVDAEIDSLPDEHMAIHYINYRTGEILVSSERSAEGSKIGDRGVAWRTAEGEGGSLAFDGVRDVQFSEVYLVDGEGRIAFATPIAGTENKAIVNVVDPTTISSSFRQPYDGAYTQIVGIHGDVQADADTEDLRSKYEVDPEAKELAHAGNVGVNRNEEAGLMVAYAPVMNTQRASVDAAADWTVLVHVPTDQAMAVKSAINRNVLLIIGLALLGFVLVGATIGRNTVSSLTDLTETANKLEAGELDTEVRSNRMDEIGQLFTAFGNMRDSLKERISEAQEAKAEAEQAEADAEAARQEAEALAQSIERKADSYSTQMERAAAGDLTVRVDAESRSDAMTRVGEAVNQMLDELEGMIANVRDFADDVATSSRAAETSTEEIQRASEEVSESVQEITDGATRQSDDLENVSTEMSDLSATIEEVASSADEVASVADQAVTRGEEGREAAEVAMQEMNEIEAKTEETMTEVESLDGEMEEIGEIVDLITEITEQTNMLALNASIEAARAGEAGEGFAVVADEIKSLAAEAAEATQDIEELITDIQSSTGETVSDMREMGERVDTGMETVEDAITALEDIVDRVDEANAGIQEINDATDEQATSTEEVVSKIEDVASISQQTSAESQNVSAAAEQQTASVTEVSENIQTLADRAEDLQDMLAEFEIDETGAVDATDTVDRSVSADGGDPRPE